MYLIHIINSQNRKLGVFPRFCLRQATINISALKMLRCTAGSPLSFKLQRVPSGRYINQVPNKLNLYWHLLIHTYKCTFYCVSTNQLLPVTIILLMSMQLHSPSVQLTVTSFNGSFYLHSEEQHMHDMYLLLRFQFCRFR